MQIRINFYLPKQAIMVAAALLAIVTLLVGSPTLAQSDSRSFPQTGKTVRGKFLAYWDTHGGLPQQGYPISDEFDEVSDLNGQPYRVQYFERAVFELHPENQPPNDVLLSQLGTFRYRQKYGGGNPPPAATQPAANSVPVELIIASGSVPRGDDQEITVATLPGAKVEIVCEYNGGSTSNGCSRSGFADNSGNYDVNWTIESTAPLGPVIVAVRASKDGKTGETRGKFTIR